MQKSDRFLRDILRVCAQYDLTFEHEDPQGAFIVVEREGEPDADWFLGCAKDRKAVIEEAGALGPLGGEVVRYGET